MLTEGLCLAQEHRAAEIGVQDFPQHHAVAFLSGQHGEGREIMEPEVPLLPLYFQLSWRTHQPRGQ